MFDQTKEIGLDKKWHKTYYCLRFAVYALFFLAALFVVHKIVFPSATFDFFFRTPNAAKNSVIEPRTASGDNYTDGKILSENELVFDTSLVGDFSRLTTDFKLEKASPERLEGKMEIRKSYRAFFYPFSGTLGFKDGSLLKNGSDYFIVSDGSLRKFSTAETFEKLGFKKEAFLEISLSELSLHPIGSDVTLSSSYPADALFRVLDEYYKLKNGVLTRFVSEKAYLSQYSPTQAILKQPSFLDSYTVSDDYLGFSDGTLLAAGISVYLVEGQEIHPINNPTTLESMGYLWTDVIEANSEEIAIYEKKKLFTLSSAHPTGTIFRTEDSNKYYYIQGKTKKEISSLNALRTYPQKNPIAVREESLTVKTDCDIEPRLGILRLYRCEASIESIKGFPGNSYQFRTAVDKTVEIENIEVEFSQVLTWENLLRSLASLKNKVTNNYLVQ